MNKRLLLIVPIFLAAGCSGSGSEMDARAVPADAKITDVKEPPINAETRFAAGQLAESMSRWTQAIEQYNLAVEVDPKHQQALYRLGILNAQEKNYPAAIEAWEKYLKATNYSGKAYGNLGFCYELSGDYEKAEATYKKGIERAHKDQLCRVNYGLMLAKQGRTNEAFVQLKAVLPTASAHYNMGSIYEAQGKMAQAKMEYTRSLEADPTFFEAQQRLAAIQE
jgi:tetratricopeptide (TPR) repeat protein